MNDIRIGCIGLGCRGFGILKEDILPQGEVVAAVCDVYEDRIQAAKELVVEMGGNVPKTYTDYHDVINDDAVNTIVIASSWEGHVEIAIEAMRAGKAVAMEVGGAYTVQECWDLVQAYEETGTPFMFLENCCFGRRELMALNMVQKGILGEIVHCSGGYHHDLREEIVFGKENRHYRLNNYIARNCENYPTHELGPIAKILNINHGNRMVSLTSTASKSAGLHEYILQKKNEDEQMRKQVFAQGDIVTTVIKCANGETIVLTLDTTLPRYYSRGFTVRGTKGMYEEATDSVYLDCEEDRSHDWDWRENCVGNAVNYQEQYEHPLWKQYLEEGIHGGHLGIDWLEFKVFFDAIRNHKPMPIDVYDAASWMVITPLSEKSIQGNGAVVEIPDFTKGNWKKP